MVCCVLVLFGVVLRGLGWLVVAWVARGDLLLSEVVCCGVVV